jgi:hypothetical protein
MIAAVMIAAFMIAGFMPAAVMIAVADTPMYAPRIAHCDHR